MSVQNTSDMFEFNRELVFERGHQDGKLVSPIDLSLEDCHPLVFDRLKWMNLDDVPGKMRITNTGETVIVSGKWKDQRPYISGGPLNGNYVFSQIHYHWGSNEHEGSEHTVKGVSYPLEMHMVFYKTRYLTQEAALKQEDGIVIVVYLVKLSEKTTPGLKWLASQLEKVVDPQTCAVLPPSPLSALVVPFTQDYLLYWGALVTVHCSHTMQWLVSRAALAINSDDLNLFRKLLNTRKEHMSRNFRETSSRDGRIIFHINPSIEKTHLLLPGSIDPPGPALIVNYSQTPQLSPVQANRIFSKGDCTDNECSLGSGNKKLSHAIAHDQPSVCEGKRSKLVRSPKLKSKYGSIDSTNDSSPCSSKPGTPRITRDKALKTNKLQNQREAKLRKEMEKKRKESREEYRKPKIFTKPHNNNISNERESLPGYKRYDTCVYHGSFSTHSFGSVNNLESKPNTAPNATNSFGVPQFKARPSSRSKLPVRVDRSENKGQESSLAKYFEKPASSSIPRSNKTTCSKPVSPIFSPGRPTQILSNLTQKSKYNSPRK